VPVEGLLNRLRRLMPAGERPGAQGGEEPDRLRISVAALLVELARADFEQHEAEERQILALLARYYGLTDAQAVDLLAEAERLVDHSVSLREFTAPLHEGLSYREKEELIAMLWTVALEDRQLDKYEEFLIGKLAELLYVSRGDVIRLRYQAQQRLAARSATK
jgi:uncharacterized tellurite resistance protein B-like protein